MILNGRDLLKWCKRILGLGFSFSGDGLSAYECNCIYQEVWLILMSLASFSSSFLCGSSDKILSLGNWSIVLCSQAVDIFAAFSTSAENRLTIMKDIAKMWAVPASVTESLYPHSKPMIQVMFVVWFWWNFFLIRWHIHAPFGTPTQTHVFSF